jgi:hypothetical protein
MKQNNEVHKRLTNGEEVLFQAIAVGLERNYKDNYCRCLMAAWAGEQDITKFSLFEWVEFIKKRVLEYSHKTKIEEEGGSCKYDKR